MKTLSKIFILIAILSASSGCQELIFDVEYTNHPIDNFEAMWTEFDVMYGGFRVKGIDWDAVYQVYRPQVSGNTSKTELYETMVNMLSILDDGHVVLIPVGTSLPQYVGGPRGRIDTTHDFNLNMIREQYLTNWEETDLEMTIGEIGDVAYVHIPHFSGTDKIFSEETESIIKRFADKEGMIIDLRGGDGGDDIAGKAIASHFTSENRLYMRTKIKNGTGPDDFTAEELWFIEPKPTTFLKPVVLLTHRQTISATETFALAMRTIPQVTIVGDTTAGAFSNLALRELPNGWIYTMSIGEWKDADGISHEGIGIIPDSLVENTRSEILLGIDRALNAAIDRIN